MAPARHLVVVAGAEPAATDALAAALRDDGTVRTAYSVDALFESLDEEVDVVLVDDALADGSVEPLLADLRSHESDVQVGVIADDPERGDRSSADAVVGRDTEAVAETVEWLAARARYRRRLEEFYALAEERAARSDEEESLARLDHQIDRLRRDLDERFRRLDDTSAFDAALSHEERAFGGAADAAGDDTEPDDRSDAG